MATVNGIDGDVTYAAGYVDEVHRWSVSDSTPSLDTTPFGVNWRARPRGAISDWSGEYSCWKSATINTDFATAGDFYSDDTVHSFSLSLTADDLINTPFGVSYNTRQVGLLSGTGSYIAYIDDGSCNIVLSR